MYVICKLDKALYSGVSPEIVTDEVVITDIQIAHIQQRHPTDYERFFSYLPRMILQPDYIVEDKNPNTAIILKMIDENGERFRLVLRLVTPNDNPSYKNSVLTFWKTHESEWKRLLKNKKVLYSRE